MPIEDSNIIGIRCNSEGIYWVAIQGTTTAAFKILECDKNLIKWELQRDEDLGARLHRVNARLIEVFNRIKPSKVAFVKYASLANPSYLTIASYLEAMTLYICHDKGAKIHPPSASRSIRAKLAKQFQIPGNGKIREQSLKVFLQQEYAHTGLAAKINDNLFQAFEAAFSLLRFAN